MSIDVGDGTTHSWQGEGHSKLVCDMPKLFLSSGQQYGIEFLLKTNYDLKTRKKNARFWRTVVANYE